MKQNKKLIKIAKWEYQTLKDDMVRQGENWEYEGNFDKWFEKVFLIDDAWEEIRNNLI